MVSPQFDYLANEDDLGEERTYLQLFNELELELRTLNPEWVDSREDPLFRNNEAMAYLALIMLERKDESQRQSTLHYATGINLDRIGQTLNVPRLSNETDENYKQRIPIELASLSVGTKSAILANVYKANSDIFDVQLIIVGRNITAYIIRENLDAEFTAQELTMSMLITMKEYI